MQYLEASSRIGRKQEIEAKIKFLTQSQQSPENKDQRICYLNYSKQSAI